VPPTNGILTNGILFGYTGKQLDEATSLQHNLNRWYDARLGQWISEDPIGFAAGDENVRRYVGNLILLTSDPSGLIDPAQDQYLQYQREEAERENLETILKQSALADIDAKYFKFIGRQVDFSFDCDHVSSLFINYATNTNEDYDWPVNEPDYSLFFYAQDELAISIYDPPVEQSGLAHAYVLAEFDEHSYLINVTMQRISERLSGESEIRRELDDDASRYRSYRTDLREEETKVNRMSVQNQIWNDKYDRAQQILMDLLQYHNSSDPPDRYRPSK